MLQPVARMVVGGSDVGAPHHDDRVGNHAQRITTERHRVIWLASASSSSCCGPRGRAGRSRSPPTGTCRTCPSARSVIPTTPGGRGGGQPRARRRAAPRGSARDRVAGRCGPGWARSRTHRSWWAAAWSSRSRRTNRAAEASWRRRGGRRAAARDSRGQARRVGARQRRHRRCRLRAARHARRRAGDGQPDEPGDRHDLEGGADERAGARRRHARSSRTSSGTSRCRSAWSRCWSIRWKPSA